MASEPQKKPNSTPRQSVKQDSAAPVPAPPASHAADAIATAMMRDRYLHEKHYFLMRQIYVQYALLALLVVGSVVLAMRPVKEVFIATDTSGKLTQLVPLDEPITTAAELSTWVTSAVTQAYTFGVRELQAGIVRLACELHLRRLARIREGAERLRNAPGRHGKQVRHDGGSHGGADSFD